MSRKVEYVEVDEETYNKIYSQYSGDSEKQDFHHQERYYVNKELLDNE